MIPPFRDDGYLPEGLHPATEPEVLFRLGSSNPKRRMLTLRLRRWIELARAVNAKRLAVAGSYVSQKESPKDLDGAILLSKDYMNDVRVGVRPAVELYWLMDRRGPDDLFASRTSARWEKWIEFLGRIRDDDVDRRGVVEILL